MCGFHTADGTPVGHHHHHPPKRVFRPTPGPLGRRAFLGDVGRGTLALAVVAPVALAACGSDGDSTAAPVDVDPTAAPTVEPDPTAAPTVEPDPTAAPTAEPDPTAAPTVAADPTAVPAEAPGDELRWERANLGFVSAYVLARGNRATIVDTGVPGSAGAIGESLAALGLNYSDVEHVILTHHHQDHAGSIAAVVAEAVNATVYAGEADLGSIDQTDIVGLVGGEDVFGFEVLHTPGHTDGHVAVIDHAAGVLVVGDAIFGDAGGVIEGPEQFFSDIPESRESIKKLGALAYNTLLFGHGEPIEDRADTAVAALAASLS